MLDSKIIGERLKACREASGEKQTDIANLLNAQRQIVSYYETGARIPNIEDLVTLAKHFNVSTDYLLGLQKEPVLNEDIKAICAYTGLSKNAVKNLNEAFVSQLGNNLPAEERAECESMSHKAADILSYLIVGIPDNSLITSAFLLAYYEKKGEKLLCDFKEKSESNTISKEDVLNFLHEAQTKQQLQRLNYYEAIDSFKYAADAYIEKFCPDISIIKMYESLINKFDCVKGVIKWQA